MDEPLNDPRGWSKAAVVGLLAGIPTCVLLQTSFIATMRDRHLSIRRLRGMPAFYPPGLSHAFVRDVSYWTGTQRQVQDKAPSWYNALICQFFIVAAPTFFDTMAVKSVEPKYRPPPIRNIGALLSYGMPPQALLGRFIWVPAYNNIYVTTQQIIGTSTPLHSWIGLAVGSVSAAFIAYPLFMFKTSILLDPPTTATNSTARKTLQDRFNSFRTLMSLGVARTCGASSMKDLGKRLLTHSGRVGVVRTMWTGVIPHILGNIGPDVLCFGIARHLYMEAFEGKKHH